MTSERGVLPLTALRQLNNLGRLIRASLTEGERDQAVALALTEARRYRGDGYAWDVIAVALGLPEPEIKEWLFNDAPKTVTPPQEPPTTTIDLTTWTPPRPSSSQQNMSMQVSQSFSISQPAHFNAQHTVTDRTTAVERREVLVISGDPRPGGNFFGPEVASIRTALGPDRFQDLTCPDLSEITPALIRYRPAVLHIAAHHENGGVVLSRDGRPLWTDHQMLARQIRRAPAHLKLVVLSMCDATALAARLASPSLAVIAWPDQLHDDYAREFAEPLYRLLAAGTTLTTACATASDCVTSRWPDVTAPHLHHPTAHRLF
ncbi:hypothetical protein [Actinomadura rayongensis]|uniref:CHAT domain-containing protein n=1 Tax=Actinomadura rayongensis TaxID=1429076 RepID=A0A6I4WK98_9ACTN|nr:hypothetical protein [Actinomadura rayongensis]MXQ67042.1 hypothetical protein [Actinomadura rayongensis]